MRNNISKYFIRCIIFLKIRGIFSKNFTKTIRRVFSKTFAIAEKNLLTNFRFKYGVVMGWFVPLITFLMPIIILNKFFEFENYDFGPWTPQNYLIFIFIGYNIMIMKNMIDYIPRYLLQEKYWKTLPALITAPFNRFYLLFGFIISEFLSILIPFMTFFIVMLIFIPVSIETLIFIVLMFIGVGIVFSGTGLFLGAFAISNENYLHIFGFASKLILWFSCITYPFELFPGWVKNVIRINPIYYLIDIIRLTWIENNIILTISSHIMHFFIFIIFLIIFPIICVYFFNIIYKKLGISGY
ncbi:MAG: ABC transporter permease [Promethearchaeota archaeon]